MPSTVGLEVMNSTNPELSWKLVKKGRRSKKSVARSLNSAVKAGNSISPKRVGDFSGSDSDKFGEVIIEQATSGKSKNVPLKKRRHLLQSPSAPWASSVKIEDSNPLRICSSSPLLEDGMHLQNPNYSSGDFSGIELLAAAATSMDDGIFDADKKVLPQDSSILKHSKASTSAIMPEQDLKNNEQVLSMSSNDVLGGIMDSQDKSSAAACQGLSTCPEDDIMPKVSREHWDLNTPMDAWGEQYDDSIAGNTLVDANVGMHVEKIEKHCGDHLLSDPASLVGEEKSTLDPGDGMGSEPLYLDENLQEPLNSIGCDTSSQSCKKDAGDKNPIRAFGDSEIKIMTQVTRPDINVGSSPLSKLSCSSGTQKMEENNAISGSPTTVRDGDCSSNISECERTAANDGTRTGTDEVKSYDLAASEFTTDVQFKDTEVSPKTCELLGTSVLDAQPVASTDSNKEIYGAFHSISAVVDCKQHMGLGEPNTKHGEGSNLPKLESTRTMTEDTCKIFSAGVQCDKPTTVGRMVLPVDGPHDLNVSQDNHGDGDDVTGCQEGYDSSYEDGELRCPFLYSWEDNELENECVDYESDGRNEDGSDAADYLGSEVLEGGSEGTHGTQRSLSHKRSAEGKNKSGQAKYHSKKNVVKDDSDNNEIAGKASNAGSGSTVEQCMEMAIVENDARKRLELVDHKNAVDVRVRHMDEYASNTAKGKLQSHIEGRSSADPTDGKGVFFIQQSRPRRVAGAYPRPERDISPDRYPGRYRPAAASGEGDGVNQWTSWFPKRRYTTNYQGGEGRNFTRPRNKIGESANKIDGVECHEQRQTNYLSKGLHRPFIRRSPVERDDYFAGRRMPPTRGGGGYRSTGNYSQRPGRDFVEDFKPLPEDVGAPVRMPRYLSKRDRSFSPSNNGRQTHMNLPRRRSRSRSRTRSPPRPWHPHREQRMFGGRRLSRSPDFRSEARMERMRPPFSKATFASDYGEGGYISPSRGRFSPQRNCRWVDDRDFGDNNHSRRRRSPPPVKMFRRNQRFDGVGSSGRFKSDDYFRPAMQRPGRFTYMPNGGRECKLESSYDDRRRDDNGIAGNMRRFRHNGMAGDDSEAKSIMSNEEKEIRVEVPPNQGGEREDKKAFII